jgi:hypothetical protein
MDEKEKRWTEESLKFLDIQHTKGYNIPEIYNIWYRAKTEGELNFIIRWFSYDMKQVRGQKDLHVGEWFTVTMDYIPNVGWTSNFVALKDYKKSVNKMFMEINAIKEELG